VTPITQAPSAHKKGQNMTTNAQAAAKIADLAATLTATLIDAELNKTAPRPMGYARELETPKNMREGLANAVQHLINLAERGDLREVVLMAVDLRSDIESSANPYELRD
jgi:hypothetical protein